jgi:hypothetical protein
MLGEPVILEGRDELRREARGVEQAPERVARPGEVVAEQARARARVDADKQDLRARCEDVGEAGQRR